VTVWSLSNAAAGKHREEVARFWIHAPDDALEMLWDSIFGEATRLLITQLTPLTAFSSAELQLRGELLGVMRQGFNQPGAVKVIIAAFLLSPPGTLVISDPETKMPAWVLPIYRQVYQPEPPASVTSQPSRNNSRASGQLNLTQPGYGPAQLELQQIEPDSKKNRQDLQSIKICILTIATNKYRKFIGKLYEDILTKFCPGAQINFILFTNHESINAPGNIRIHHIEHEAWPMSTLKRYNHFIKEKDFILEHDFCFYFDADMRIDGLIGKEVLSDGLVTTKHPGQSFNHINEMSYDRNPQSLAYVRLGEGKSYYAGGFNGGKSIDFVRMAEEIAKKVNIDLEKGIIALWHDESHLNRYLLDNPPALELTPSYCYPEEFYGTDFPYEPKIIALLKNHNEIRS